jgi:hypothetical protein
MEEDVEIKIKKFEKLLTNPKIKKEWDKMCNPGRNKSKLTEQEKIEILLKKYELK